MATEDAPSEPFADKEHQVAYIFDPSEDVDQSARPAKRRKVSRKHGKDAVNLDKSSFSVHRFQPLFDGAESEECVQLRQEVFEHSWSNINERINHVLREANQSTLENVTSFLKESKTREATDKIPSAFIITGANMSSQDLLFEQLSDSLPEEMDARVVRLRSGDASNLKAALKKIVHDVTSTGTASDHDVDLTVSKDGRKYLNYDLGAVYDHLKANPRSHVVIIFQDSEAFDSGLLSDLIVLFSSWLDRIPFSLLLGVATSVELFQARLLKSTCQLLYGDQFDVEQSASVIEKILKAAVAHVEAPLRIGPTLLSTLIERQRDQVAGIPLFVSSLKYAYMCHFYSNPLSIIGSDKSAGCLQKQHLELIRSLPSFRTHIESILEAGQTRQVKQLLDDDEHLGSHLRELQTSCKKWVLGLLCKVQILATIAPTASDFVQVYLEALTKGIKSAAEDLDFFRTVQRMTPGETMSLLTNILDTARLGDASLGLEPWSHEMEQFGAVLSGILAEISTLQAQAEKNGSILKSKYSSQSKVLRTTVIAQKVQLSHDTAGLTDEDKSYTKKVDQLVQHLEAMLEAPAAESMLLHEAWLYDFRMPHREVFVPRPRTVVERALSRPHDYLSCDCCRSKHEQIMPSLPTTAIIYQLYLETGSVINVADVWSAYYAIVGDDDQDGLDERTALVLFYRGLSELRAMGFVKQSRKKADHIAKLAWRGL